MRLRVREENSNEAVTLVRVDKVDASAHVYLMAMPWRMYRVLGRGCGSVAHLNPTPGSRIQTQ